VETVRLKIIRGQDGSSSNLNYPHQNHGSSCQEHVSKLLCHSSDSSPHFLFFCDFTIYFSNNPNDTCIGMYKSAKSSAILWIMEH